MPRLVSWPMYALDHEVVDRLWRRLRQALVDTGITAVPTVLTDPDDLAAHWRDPDLLLSQTCGFPFVTGLRERVRYVGTPCFTAPSCEDAYYRSAVVVRRDDPAESLRDMAGRRVAFNGRDSQSGYNGLRAIVAPLATRGGFFGDAIETGSHRASVRAVTADRADVAAIDAVTLALLGDYAPDEITNLRVLCHTALVPGLPMITAAGTSDDELLKLRRALAEACRGDTAEARALRLCGFAVLPEESYDTILAQRDHASVLGYSEFP